LHSSACPARQNHFYQLWNSFVHRKFHHFDFFSTNVLADKVVKLKIWPVLWIEETSLLCCHRTPREKILIHELMTGWIIAKTKHIILKNAQLYLMHTVSILKNFVLASQYIFAHKMRSSLLCNVKCKLYRLAWDS
jgi:hypothetical protein